MFTLSSPASSKAGSCSASSTALGIHYLRLSVTDLCNLRCRYCMPDGVEKLEREAVLTYEEFLRLAAPR